MTDMKKLSEFIQEENKFLKAKYDVEKQATKETEEGSSKESLFNDS
jgi:hypothetical protein